MVLWFILGVICSASAVCLAMLLSPEPKGPLQQVAKIGDRIRFGETSMTLTETFYGRDGSLRATFDSTVHYEARNRIR